MWTTDLTGVTLPHSEGERRSGDGLPKRPLSPLSARYTKSSYDVEDRFSGAELPSAGRPPCAKPKKGARCAGRAGGPAVSSCREDAHLTGSTASAFGAMLDERRSTVYRRTFPDRGDDWSSRRMSYDSSADDLMMAAAGDDELFWLQARATPDAWRNRAR